MKLLSDFCNHISNTICYAGICGGAGYLASRVINQVDPYTGLVCGAIAGATTVLFFNENANLARKTIGVAILVLAPLRMCQHLKLPAVPVPVCLAVSGVTAALAIFIQIFHEHCIRRQKRLELELDLAKMDQFEMHSETMQEDVVEECEETVDMQEDVSEKKKKFDKVLQEMEKKKRK